MSVRAEVYVVWNGDVRGVVAKAGRGGRNALKENFREIFGPDSGHRTGGRRSSLCSASKVFLKKYKKNQTPSSYPIPLSPFICFITIITTR